MIVEIKIPSPGESITEVQLGNWLVDDGTYVKKDQEVGEVESDKATLPLIAPENGVIRLKAKEGDTLKVGAIVCEIDTEAKGAEKKETVKPKENIATKPPEPLNSEPKPEKSEPKISEKEHIKISPVAQKMMDENQLSIEDVLNGLKRIGKKEIDFVLQHSEFHDNKIISREVDVEKMSPLRKKLSERLVSVKNETAMLTTFNEVDMSTVMEIRKKYQDRFVAKYGIKLGFMSFFTKAASVALQLFPRVNSMIDGENIVSPQYTDIGIAVQTDKGLMVPVLRNVETQSLADIEKNIAEMAGIARKGRLSMEAMTGGTFTITNGGVFGSLFSTPIINPPQSAILGMHNIVDRPVAINGKVEIRPMMYIALSYDHRIIDGKDSVSFLLKVKHLIENPSLLLFMGKGPEEKLLEI